MALRAWAGDPSDDRAGWTRKSKPHARKQEPGKRAVFELEGRAEIAGCGGPKIYENVFEITG